MASIVTAADGK